MEILFSTLLGVILTIQLLTGRALIAQGFLKNHYATRRDTPVLYWFFTLVLAAFTGVAAYLAVLRKLQAPEVQSLVGLRPCQRR